MTLPSFRLAPTAPKAVIAKIREPLGRSQRIGGNATGVKSTFKRGMTLCAALLSLGAFQGAAHAAQLFWDADGDTSITTGGAGTWNATALTWRDGSSTGTLQAWADGNEAVFGGTAGTVTCNTSFAPTGLTFTTALYIVTGTGTLTIDALGIDASTLTSGTTTLGTSGTSGTTPVILRACLHKVYWCDLHPAIPLLKWRFYLQMSP